MFQSSRQSLEEGMEVFRSIGDLPNVALLSCNLRKLYRVEARALAPTEEKKPVFPSGNATQKLVILKLRTLQDHVLNPVSV